MPLDLALTDAGYNGKTARYGFSRANNGTGDVLFDNTQAYAVMGSVACKKNRYWADSTHGSDLSNLKTITRFTPSPTPSQAVAMALDALVPLEPGAQNLITANPTARAKRIALNGLAALELAVSWSTPGGQQQTRTIRP